MKLYELAANYQELLLMADEMEPEAWEALLHEIEGALEDKAESMAKVWKTLKAEAAAIKAEADALAKRSKARENQAERLREYLKQNMEAAGLTKLEAGTQQVRIQNNPLGVTEVEPIDVDPKWRLATVVMNEADVPEAWEDWVTDARLNKGLALAHFKETGEVPDGLSITKGTHLRIE